MNDIKLSDKYSPLFSDKSRYFIITGGRGSSKSFTVSVFLLNLTYQVGHKILFTRYTMKSADTSIIPEFIEKLEMMGVSDDFRITRDEIINLTTGSSIIFKGIKTASGNQTAALKSLTGITTFVVDEAEELVDEAIFDKIDLSVRKKNIQNRVILLMNPATKEHWVHKRFFEKANIDDGSNETTERVTYIHTTYKDNKENLPEDYLLNIFEMKMNNPHKYEHQILGGWLNKADGVIIENWRVGQYLQTEHTCYGQDFGFSDDPTTLVQVSIDRQFRKIYAKSLFGKIRLSTQDIIKRDRRYCGSSLIVCDTEPRLVQEVKRGGINLKPAIKKHGSILSGIALLQDYEIIVDPSSKELIKELNNYVWHEKNEKPIDEYNHYIDAMRYAVQYLLQGKKSGMYVIR